MATKKSVTFYAAKDVAEWLSGFDEEENVSQRINQAIREGALKPKSLFQISLNFYQMGTLLEVLKAEEKRRQDTADNVYEEDMAAATEHAHELSRLLAHFEQYLK